MTASLTPIGLSLRTLTLPASPIRALLDAHRGPNTLDLGGGIPDPDLFPNDLLAVAAEKVLRKSAALSLQYAKTAGLDALRETVAERLRKRGLGVTCEQIVITHGSQQAIATLSQVLTERGTPAMIEQPVYPGALQALLFAEASLHALPVTQQGWDLSVFDRCVPRLAYVIAHHQNPTGRRASDSEKRQLADLAERKRFYIVEDDAYGELDFSESLTRPLAADCPNFGILVGSFSKTLCPGLRMGFIACPHHLRDAIEKSLQATALQPGTLTQFLVSELLKDFDYESHLDRLRQLYAARARALASRLAALGVESDAISGGFFLWTRTPSAASDFVAKARSRGLLAVPEAAFRAPGLAGPDNHIRLAFSRYLDDAASQSRLRAAFGAKDVL